MKKIKKKKKPPTKAAQHQPYTEIRHDEGDEGKPFDFGGLPDRDLKKNLGCGG